jgi:hypothetical protein
MIALLCDLAKRFIHMVTDNQIIVDHRRTLGHLDYFHCGYKNKLLHENIILQETTYP